MRVTINNQEVDIAVRFMGERTLNEEMEVMREIRNRLKEPETTRRINTIEEDYGKISQCEKCSEILSSFMAYCPDCGCRIIGDKEC